MFCTIFFILPRHRSSCTRKLVQLIKIELLAKTQSLNFTDTRLITVFTFSQTSLHFVVVGHWLWLCSVAPDFCTI